MENNILWSLRLGFSAKQAIVLKDLGMAKFLQQSFGTSGTTEMPEFLQDDPKTLLELRTLRDKVKDNNSPEVKIAIKKQIQNATELKSWWIDKMISEELPLREKMTCFWHNHFVSTSQKVKINYWIYQHNSILRENAFGNYKTLTKKILRSNAMVRYLDNVDNRGGKINENLSRELLELFTLGIGNYSEEDVKNGAKGLAGLSVGENFAVYRPFLQDNDTITYFGKIGKFKSDELVDIIFEQPEIPYLLTRKILKWFIYDNPDEKLVRYYGDYFRTVDFEMQPLLGKIFTEEYAKNNTGTKIKDPLVFIIQLLNELGVQNPNTRLMALFLRQQGMDLFNQPNVKGWDGGKYWLTSQIFLQRHNVSDLLCNGKNLSRQILKNTYPEMQETDARTLDTKFVWNKKGDNKAIIAELTNRLLFDVNDTLQADFEKILKYDFDPTLPGADNAVLRLFNAMVKTPEYQLI